MMPNFPPISVNFATNHLLWRSVVARVVEYLDLAATLGSANRQPELRVMVRPPLVVVVRGLLGEARLAEILR